MSGLSCTPVTHIILSLLLTGFCKESRGGSPQQNPQTGAPLGQLNLEQLGNIEVTTASKEPEKVWRTAAAIYVLTQEDIRRSGAKSIPEVLSLVPGLQAAQINSSSWAVGIRGFGNGFSKSVLVLIDGRSVYTPLFAGVYWSVQNVLLADVERIEVIRGPGGTVWGANAVNGVINIITKKSKDTQGMLVSLSGGNVEQGAGGFRYGGSYGENIDYRVYGMAFSRGAEFHADGGNFDPWQFGQAGFRVDWDNQSRDKLSLQGNIYKGEVGNRTDISSYSPPSSMIVDGAQELEGGHFLGQWQHALGDGSDIQVQGYYDRTYTLAPNIGETRNTFDIDFIHHLTRLPRQDIIWGLGARWSPGDIIQTVATANFLPHHQSNDIYSIFVQDEISLVENKLWATLGSKLQHNIYTGWEVMPSARLLWTPRPRQTFWAAATRAIRTPSRIDRDLQLTSYAPNLPVPTFITVVGNPNFRSETLLGYEAGYRSLITPRVYVDISLFHNRYDNLIDFESLTLSVESTPPPPHLLVTVPWGNGIAGTTTGGEIAPHWKAAHWLEFKGSYSYLNMNLKAKPGAVDTTTVAQDIGSSPNHQAVFQSLITLPNGFEIDASYRYVGALPALSVNGAMGVRLGWHFARGLELSLNGQNLLQPRHLEFTGDPGLPTFIKRSVYTQLTWRR